MMNNLAGIVRTTGQYREAEELYRRVLKIRLEMTPTAREPIAYARYGLGYALVELGEPEQAEEALRLTIEAFPEGDPRRDVTRIKLGEALTQTGQRSRAEAVLIQAHQNLADAGSPASRDAASALSALYSAWGRSADAERYAALARQ
jgi:tetratricopeptide (TPR) repeat protein